MSEIASQPTSDRLAPIADGPIPRLARWALAHRRLVIAIWIVAFLAGGMGAGNVSKRLSFNFALPGQPGYETAQQIAHGYGNGGESPSSIVVVTAPGGRTIASEQQQVAAAFAHARSAVPRVRIVDYGATKDARFLTSDGHSTYAIVFTPIEKTFGAPKVPVQVQNAVASALPGAQVQLTGLSQLANGGSEKGPGVFVETLIGGAGALVVLAFVFASLLALVPLLIAAVSILTTLLVVLALTYVAEVSFVVQFLVSLVGLGVAIDYSLLIVTRWREERDHGRENSEAVVAAMATAGRAVLLSGLTVAIGLLALIVLPVPGLRSVGYGGMLIPLISTTIALTLLPAMLGGIGPRVDWPKLRHESQASRGWTAWTRGVVRRRGFAAGIAVVALGLLIVPLFSLTTGQTSASALAKNGSAREAYDRLIAGGVSSGVLTPMEVLAHSGQAQAVARRLATVPGVADVALSSAADSTREGTTVLLAIPAAQTDNSNSLASVRATRTAMKGQAGAIGVAGEGAIELDYQHAVFGTFPLMFAIVALLTIALLTRAFRSLVLAVKAVLLNLISMAAAFGLMTWFWQEGHGSNAVFGIPATGAIAFWIPLMVFAFLFGLSMDYEVFILARVREEYDLTGSTDGAVIEGLGRTGRLVTSAALILFLAFASLAAAPSTEIKVLATGLGFGILLDATLIRALLLPAVVSLLGDWNWWLPRPVARALRIPQPRALPAQSAVEGAS
ncbi:MAG TPA: MMPL family transporter [Solirubrobacteraceae bacterium]|jgi:RND superfamily putative drug exporter|nr:MMPL family transporter [Solirubrobacteraceae bacterium]